MANSNDTIILTIQYDSSRNSDMSDDENEKEDRISSESHNTEDNQESALSKSTACEENAIAKDKKGLCTPPSHSPVPDGKEPCSWWSRVRRGPRTPSLSPPRRGPRTPPGVAPTSDSEDNWRSGCLDIAEIQIKARCEGRLTDIQFVSIEGKTRKVFNAHKVILALGSPVFEKMFFGGLAEKGSVIEIHDDPEAFEMLLNYFYGKNNQIESLTSAWKYITIGDKYLVREVQENVKQYIESMSFNESTFWDVIKNNYFQSPLFIDKVSSYIIENTRDIINSKQFLSMPEVFVKDILQKDKLNAREYEILLAVTKWGYKNIQQANPKYLMEFYKYIRFSAMTSDEFYQFIESYPDTIDAESIVKILKHLNNPSCQNLPDWCSKIKSSRFVEFQGCYVDSDDDSDDYSDNYSDNYSDSDYD